MTLLKIRKGSEDCDPKVNMLASGSVETVIITCSETTSTARSVLRTRERVRRTCPTVRGGSGGSGRSGFKRLRGGRVDEWQAGEALLQWGC